MKKINSYFFYGNEISNYGKENGYVDYATLAKAFDAVRANDITKLFFADIHGEYNEPEIYSGTEYNEEAEEYFEVFQYYIISEYGAEILQEWTDEIVYYLPAVDMYIWGVTHFNTSWDYVLTNIKIEMGE